MINGSDACVSGDDTLLPVGAIESALGIQRRRFSGSQRTARRIDSANAGRCTPDGSRKCAVECGAHSRAVGARAALTPIECGRHVRSRAGTHVRASRSHVRTVPSRGRCIAVRARMARAGVHVRKLQARSTTSRVCALCLRVLAITPSYSCGTPSDSCAEVFSLHRRPSAFCYEPSSLVAQHAAEFV